MNPCLVSSATLALAGLLVLTTGCSAEPALSAAPRTASELRQRSDALVAPLPVAIFHAFDQDYTFLKGYVCDLAGQGYSHVQIAPAQESHDTGNWKGRYQPIDFTKIAGRGDEGALRALTTQAHGCGMKVIADVVFNHMTGAPPHYQGGDHSFHFAGLAASDFHPRREIYYDNGNRDDEINGWLSGLPDLDQQSAAVQAVTKGHLSQLLSLGIDGFRFDAAKHMSREAMQMYIDHVNAATGGGAWSYLEVIADTDTKGSDYNGVAAVSDFLLYNTMKSAFSFGGDLRSLQVPEALDDARSVVFGINHDTDSVIHDDPIYPYPNRGDSIFATAYVLARESGVPLILASDNSDVPFVPAGVKFRQIMRQRAEAGHNVKDNVLAVVQPDRVLFMERGSEGFFIVNKSAEKLDQPALDLTLTHLEGCYRELRNGFLVAIERRNDGNKYVTRWGSWSRGGLEVQARDALYFIREPWTACTS